MNAWGAPRGSGNVNALPALGGDDSTKKNRLTVKKRAHWLPVSLACNVVVVLSTSVCAAASHGGINGVFGMTGVVAGEVTRLTVANTAAQANETASPCQLELSFADAHGSPLVSGESGRPYLKRVTIAPGSTESLAFVAPGSAVGIGHRIAVRPLVRQLSPELSAGCTPAVSAEIFDSASRVIKVATPPDPCYPISPTDASCPTSRFDLLELDRGRTARFSAVAYPQDSVVSPEAIRVELSFVDVDGQTITAPDGKPVMAEVLLLPGTSASLDLPAISTNRIAVRPVIRQIFPSSPVPVATSLELIDSVTGATAAVAYPMPAWAVIGVKRPAGARGRYLSTPDGR